MGGKTWHDNVFTIHIKGITSDRVTNAVWTASAVLCNAVASGSTDPQQWLSLFLQAYITGKIWLDPGANIT